MSYSDDPIRDAERHLDQIEAEESAELCRQTESYANFLNACRLMNASAPADFAPMVRDFAPLQPVSVTAPLRHQTVSELLGDSLERGPTQVELHQLWLNLAFGNLPLEELRGQALALVVRSAQAWSRDN